MTGTVVSTKMHRTLIIRREYLHFIPKYSRYEKRHKNLAAHVSPAFRVEEGDQVTVGQCRPLSKTVGQRCATKGPITMQYLLFLRFASTSYAYSREPERRLRSSANFRGNVIISGITGVLGIEAMRVFLQRSGAGNALRRTVLDNSTYDDIQ